MIRLARLRPGDTVGLISPSWGGAGLFPHRVERGVQHLHSLGFQVRIGPHALNQLGFVSDTPENRVADIHAMFGDPEVKAIVAAIGGDHSCHLLPLLDFDLMAKNPKILMGFSDVTVLNVTDMDFGHTAPQFTVPLGCRARIDADHQRFEIIEAAVE